MAPLNFRAVIFNRYFSNTSWLLAEKIFRLSVTFVVWAFVIRYLGPERFGLLSFAASFVGLFAGFSAIASDGIIIRELVRDPQNTNRLLGTAFVMKLFGALIVFVLVFTTALLMGNDSLTNVLIFVIALGLMFQSFNIVDCYFQALVKSKYAVYAQILQLFLSSITKLLLVHFNASLIWFAVVTAADSLIIGLGLLWFYRTQSGRVQAWRFDPMTARNLIKDSWPLFLSGLVISVYMKIDQVMIREMLTDRAVGIYAVAVRLSESWYFIPMVITASLFPAIINAKKVNEDVYYHRLQKLYNLHSRLAVAIAVPTTFLSTYIIVWIFGKEFSEAGIVLAVHIWSAIFVFMGFINGKWILAENLGLLAFWRSLSGAILNVVLNLILIPYFGILGAAVATLASVAASTHFFFAFGPRTKMIFRMQNKSLLLIAD
ncbi:MAG: flippase [Phycisphaerae bacterium]|nr:flippase [Phycisphaerae bacterium]